MWKIIRCSRSILQEEEEEEEEEEVQEGIFEVAQDAQDGILIVDKQADSEDVSLIQQELEDHAISGRDDDTDRLPVGVKAKSAQARNVEGLEEQLAGMDDMNLSDGDVSQDS